MAYAREDRAAASRPSDPVLTVRCFPASEAPWHAYRFAATTVVTDVELEPLAPFRVGAVADPPPARVFHGTDAGTLVCEGPADLGGRTLHVSCRRAPDFSLLEIEGCAPIHVGSDGTLVQRTRSGPPSDVELDALFGPALLLAFAHRGVFCLHAGAVVRDGRTLAFVGRSGAGKSTLARELPSLDARSTRIADDILPVSLDSGASARPAFLQPRLEADAQYHRSRPETVALDAVVVLDVAPATRVRFEPMGRREAALTLVSHTIASRLFDAALAFRHLDFCAALAERIPVARLTYPRSLAALGAVRAALDASLPNAIDASGC
jgi:hypothetical protein